jgi:formate/nitrite transporter FocA (FNT family)
MASKQTVVDTSRRSAPQILDTVSKIARDELSRNSRALAFSGLAGGLTMGLTGLGVAAVQSIIGKGPMQNFVAMLFYPVGFIAVIIGRAQLFTENTLYPVVLVLDERDHVLNTLRLWGVVFASNVVGAALFAILACRTGALEPKIVDALSNLGLDMVSQTATTAFWSGVIGGWLIALLAWLVSASHWTIGQVAICWLLSFIVGIGHFSHCIASSGEILSSVMTGNLPVLRFFYWLGPATAGNILGGVLIVSLLNWGQVKAGSDED